MPGADGGVCCLGVRGCALGCGVCCWDGCGCRLFAWFCLGSGCGLWCVALVVIGLNGGVWLCGLGFLQWWLVRSWVVVVSGGWVRGLVVGLSR